MFQATGQEASHQSKPNVTAFGRPRKGRPHSLHLSAEQEDAEPGAWRQVREMGRGWTHAPSCERGQGRTCALCARMPVDEGGVLCTRFKSGGYPAPPRHRIQNHGELRGRTGAAWGRSAPRPPPGCHCRHWTVFPGALPSPSLLCLFFHAGGEGDGSCQVLGSSSS